MGIVVAAADAAAKKGSSSTTLLLLIVLVFAGFYFLMIRPQRRRQQQAQQNRQNAATPGARVRTVGGMYATIVGSDGDDVILEVAPGVEVRYMRRAIAEVIQPGDPEPVVDDESGYHDDEPGYHDDASAQDEHEVTDSATSAEGGLADSHDGRASSDKDNVF